MFTFLIDDSRREDGMPLLGKHPRKIKTHVHVKACTQTFIITLLFVIAKEWKQPKCLLADKWMNQM